MTIGGVTVVEGRVRRGLPLGVLVVVAISAARLVGISAQLVGMTRDSELADWLLRFSPAGFDDLPPNLGAITAAILIGFGVLTAAAIVGLLLRRYWGWAAAVVSSGLLLAITIGFWLAGHPRDLAMAFNVIAVFYLNQRDVRAIYRGDAP